MNEKSIYNNHERQLEEENLKKVNALASLLHEGWRKNRYNSETKIYAPRIKNTKDER